MILSVSRRTDIPGFYFNWFLNRLRAGWLLVRNPYNPRRVSRLALEPGGVECIVFWSKNPEPMLSSLESLRPYPYLIQFTLNPYGREMEAGLPDLARRLDTFLALAETVGRERLIWRYSPLILSTRYTPEFHAERFGALARHLDGHTLECRLSLLDPYPAIVRRMRVLGADLTAPSLITPAPLAALLRIMSETARDHGIRVSACCSPALEAAGIETAGCIDAALVERVVGRSLGLKKDPGQRGACQCMESVDVGMYQTCPHGCAYCYANHSHATAGWRAADYDPDSPLLCDALRPDDVVTDRKLRSRSHPVGMLRLPGL